MSKKSKMALCKNCNAPIAKEARICPKCGAKNKHSHKMRFFLLLLLIIVGITIWKNPQRVTSLIQQNLPKNTTTKTSSPNKNSLDKQVSQILSETADTNITFAPSESAVAESSTSSASTAPLQSGISPEFQQAMDSYEAFINEYCEFMKKYSESDQTSVQMLSDYANYISKYSDFVNDFDAWNDKDMTTEESAYYLDVQTRVAKKMLEIQ